MLQYMRHPIMKVLNTDSLLQDMNSLQIRTNTVISANVPNLPKVQRICHLCLEEYGTLKDLQNHISTTHNLSHPTTYYSNSTSGYSTSWKFENLLNFPKASPKHPQISQCSGVLNNWREFWKSWVPNYVTDLIHSLYMTILLISYFTLFYWLLISGMK